MRRIILLLMAVAACAIATCLALPRAQESYALLYAQDDPPLLADIAVAKAMSAPLAETGIKNALDAGDADLAASFLELAHDRGIAVDPAVAARVDAANGTGAQVIRTAASFGHGFVTGAPDDLPGSRVRRPAICLYSATFAMRCAKAFIWPGVSRRTNSSSGLLVPV